MISTFTLLFLTFTVISVSSQQVQYFSINDTSQNSIAKFNVSGADQDYIDGCKAVLQAKDDIYVTPDMWKTTYSTWKNKYSYGSLMDFFENDQGIVSKVWIDNGDWSSSWIFNLTFYDGEYVDKKFAMVQFYITSLDPSFFNQYDGTYSLTYLPVSVAYGENNRVQYTQTLQGQISIYFFNMDTNQTITDFPETNIHGDTVQITFSSYGNMLSFTTTSGFTETYPISTYELIVVSAFTLIYFIWSLCSAGTSELRSRVSIGYVAFAYASSAYIALWMFLHIQDRDNLLLLIPLFAALIDWIKQAVFIFQKNYRSPCGLIIFMTILPSVLNFVPSVWVNLFPAVTLFFPFLAKLAGGYNRQQYLNIFHLSNWICMSLWIGYFYLYPTNILLVSPQPLLVAIFFGIILAQFILSYMMEKYQRRREQHLIMMLLADPEAEPNHIYQPLLQNDQNAAPAGRNNRNNLRGRPQANPNREKKPRRKAFKYTFAAQGGAGGQEEYTVLTDECAICFDYLLGDQPEKLYKTPCGHIFHEGCLRAWGVKKLECPCCRKKLPKFKRSPINS